MLRRIAVALTAAAFLAAFSLPAAYAGKPGRPPGWDKGEKKGWKGGSEPPGLSKQKKGQSGQGGPADTVEEVGKEIKRIQKTVEEVVSPGEGRGKGKGRK